MCPCGMHPKRINYPRATGSEHGVIVSRQGCGQDTRQSSSLGFMPLLLNGEKQVSHEIQWQMPQDSKF